MMPETKFTPEFIQGQRDGLLGLRTYMNGRPGKTTTSEMRDETISNAIEALDEIERMKLYTSAFEFERDRRDKFIDQLQKENEQLRDKFKLARELYEREHPEGYQEIVDFLNAGAQKEEGIPF